MLVCIGHMKDYTKVILSYDEKLMGTCVLVKITCCKKWHVEGDIINYAP